MASAMRSVPSSSTKARTNSGSLTCSARPSRNPPAIIEGGVGRCRRQLRPPETHLPAQHGPVVVGPAPVGACRPSRPPEQAQQAHTGADNRPAKSRTGNALLGSQLVMGGAERGTKLTTNRPGHCRFGWPMAFRPAKYNRLVDRSGSSDPATQPAPANGRRDRGEPSGSSRRKPIGAASTGLRDASSERPAKSICSPRFLHFWQIDIAYRPTGR